MALCAFALPVLPGKRDTVRQLAREAHTTRRMEYLASERTFGVTRQTWHLQATPTGDLLLVTLEAPDVLQVLREFAVSTAPFSLWLKEQVRDFSGVDLSAPPDSLPSDCLGQVVP